MCSCLEASGERSLDDLVKKYVAIKNQPEWESFVNLNHPKLHSKLNEFPKKTKDRMLKPKQLIDFSYESGPFSEYRLKEFQKYWISPVKPTHVVNLKYKVLENGTSGNEFWVCYEDENWYLVEPVEFNKNRTKLNPEKDSFVYHYEATGEYRYNWKLKFSKSNSNRMKLLLVGRENKLIMPFDYINKDSHDMTYLRFGISNILEREITNNKIKIAHFYGSTKKSTSSTLFLEGNEIISFIPRKNPSMKNKIIQLAEISILNDNKKNVYYIEIHEEILTK
jgi:hypothetical protein